MNPHLKFSLISRKPCSRFDFLWKKVDVQRKTRWKYFSLWTLNSRMDVTLFFQWKLWLSWFNEIKLNACEKKKKAVVYKTLIFVLMHVCTKNYSNLFTHTHSWFLTYVKKFCLHLSHSPIIWNVFCGGSTSKAFTFTGEYTCESDA